MISVTSAVPGSGAAVIRGSAHAVLQAQTVEFRALATAWLLARPILVAAVPATRREQAVPGQPPMEKPTSAGASPAARPNDDPPTSHVPLPRRATL